MINAARLSDPNYRLAIARKLSCNSRYTVQFGEYPEHPEVRDYVTPPGLTPAMRFINLSAAPGANITRFLSP